MSDLKGQVNTNLSDSLNKEDAKNLKKLRNEIDEINNELCNLLIKRLKAAGKIVEIKERNNLPVTDWKREEEIRAKLFANMKQEEEIYRPFLEEIITNVMNSTKKWENLKKNA